MSDYKSCPVIPLVCPECNAVLKFTVVTTCKNCSPQTIQVPVEDLREFIADSVAVEQWDWDNNKIINKKRQARIDRARKLLEGKERGE